MLKVRKMISDFKNNYGVTLVELIVAISIMAVVVIPFIATSVSSSKNNSFADEKMNSYNTVNQIIEDMISMPDFLNEEADYFEGKEENLFKEYEGDNKNGFTIKYRIDRVSVGEIPDNEEGKENSYSSFTSDENENIVNDIDTRVEDEKFYINNNSYSLLPEYYYLRLSKVNGLYYYELKNSLNVFLMEENFTSIRPEINVSVNIENDTIGVLELHVDIDISMDKKVNILLVGENTDEKVNLINEGEVPFFSYNNLNENPINEYKNTLYKVDVYAEIDGKESDRMVSYVKK
jgi:prepilin-type N-terminal cleavage/methylation domain-containing protein